MRGDLLKKRRKRRKRKSIKIDDEEQSQQIMLNAEYINDQIRCVDQDPIEVILVFNSNNELMDNQESEENRVQVPPQLMETFGSNYEDFDPIKVQFVSSTTSPFSRRRSSLAASELEPPTSTSTTTTEVPVRVMETSSPKISSLLKEASVPHVVDTLPGYNILRLFTGG